MVTLFLCVTPSLLSAQSTYAVKGIITDSTSAGKMANTTICVLNAKDSTLFKFTRATANGAFAINNLSKGKFILMVTYPEYADYVELFHLDSAKTEINFGNINLTLKSKILTEVMIKGTKAQIKIKGDTTEFNASSFVIQPNAKVEDLLKQLPGIQVDKDGKITAQGQAVSKVLVDGEEFFGDDPTLVTKNIRADMVDKVQLYDKTSDQAAFTGIDDGVKSKTINIQLKADKKNGYFGKIDVGAATDQYYQGQLLLNKFSPKNKFSAYATDANTGKTGLSWEDNSKYGSSDNVQVGDDGGIYISGGNGDELDSFSGQYYGQGIPSARTGGLHDDSHWNADKQSINTNYKAGYLAVDGTNTTLTQTNLPTGLRNSNTGQNYDNSIFRQKLDATYKLKIDSSSDLKLYIDGTIKSAQTRTSYLGDSYAGTDTLLNHSNRSVTNSSDQQIINASAFYTKKFKKKGRTLSLSAAEAFNRDNSHGYLNSAINFYNKLGGVDSVQLINEYKTNLSQSSVLSTNGTYTEPITKTLAVVFNYGLGISNSIADLESYDKVPSTGEYQNLNTTLSNNFKLNQVSNQGGANFNYKTGKTTFNFGTKLTAVNFDQINQNTNVPFVRNFINFDPQASYQYNFSQRNSVRFRYTGNTTQPTINQIQPVVTNTDPLNITLGNPGLKPSFSNNLNFSYNSYKVLTDRSIYLYGSYSFTTNPIVNNTTTDTTGKTTYQSSNLSSKSPKRFYLYADVGEKIKALDVNIGLHANINGNTSYNYTNGALNTTNSYTYSGGVSLSKYSEKKYDMSVSVSPSYNVSGSSLQMVNNNGFGLTGDANFNVYLPGKVQLSTDGNYQYTAPTASFNQSLEKLIWNASITKMFLKEENLHVSITGNDLLNQNVGFSRNAYGGSITQNSYTSIKRYFMLSVTYDFSHFGSAKPKK